MIRLAEMSDLTEILRIYAHARAYMAEQGNPSQWGKVKPPRETLEQDIKKRQLYVCTNDNSIYGVFALIFGADPTYARIERGNWKSAEPYGAIHRVAGDGTVKGVFAECLEYCKARSWHLRIDTHADNRIMQHCIEKNGFDRCGMIHIQDGTPRIAYEYMEEQEENCLRSAEIILCSSSDALTVTCC